MIADVDRSPFGELSSSRLVPLRCLRPNRSLVCYLARTEIRWIRSNEIRIRDSARKAASWTGAESGSAGAFGLGGQRGEDPQSSWF